MSERIISSRNTCISPDLKWKILFSSLKQKLMGKKLFSGVSSWPILQNRNSKLSFREKVFHFNLLTGLLRPSLFVSEAPKHSQIPASRHCVYGESWTDCRPGI